MKSADKEYKRETMEKLMSESGLRTKFNRHS